MGDNAFFIQLHAVGVAMYTRKLPPLMSSKNAVYMPLKSSV